MFIFFEGGSQSLDARGGRVEWIGISVLCTEYEYDNGGPDIVGMRARLDAGGG